MKRLFVLVVLTMMLVGCGNPNKPSTHFENTEELSKASRKEAEETLSEIFTWRDRLLWEVGLERFVSDDKKEMAKAAIVIAALNDECIPEEDSSEKEKSSEKEEETPEKYSDLLET